MENSINHGTGLTQNEERSEQEILSLATSLYEDETLSCLICGLRSNQLVSHVTRVHKISSSEYYSKFPGSKLIKITEEQRKKTKERYAKRDSKNKQAKQEMKKRNEEVSSLEKLRCRICEYESSLSLISHITNKHGIKMQEYRTLYPSDMIQRSAPSQLKKQSEKMKRKLEDEDERKKFLEWRSFPSEIKHWIRKGFTEEEAIEKIAEFQSFQSKKGNNETTRLARSKKYSGDNNPMSLKSISERNGVEIRDAKKLTPCYGRSGSLHPMFGKKHADESIRKIGLHINTTHRSKVEHEMSDLVVSMYGGLKNESIDGWCCDYVNHEKKIVVEFFGDFWHHNPEKYPSNWVNPFTKRTSEYVYHRDNKKIQELKNNGYEVIVIWESDWKSDKEDEVQRIKNAFDSV